MTTLLTQAPDRTTTVPEQAAPVEVARTAPLPAVSPPRPPARRLVLRGVLSRADTAELEPRLEALAHSGARDVEVDLSRVETMDAAVARMLLRTSWRLGDPDRALVLLHPSRQVRRVLRFYGAGHLVVR